MLVLSEHGHVVMQGLVWRHPDQHLNEDTSSMHILVLEGVKDVLVT
jgi:hypothetical protein